MFPRSLKHGEIRLYTAAAVRDAAGVAARPGAVAVRGGRIVAAGPLEEIRRHHRGDGVAQVVERPRHLLLPLMVNAHAHLDLTDLGPRAYDGDFLAWLRGVAEGRPTDPAALAAAVRRGVRLSAEAGVGYLGDIAYAPAAIEARRSAPTIPGVSFLECFGLGGRQAERLRQLDERLERLEFETPVPGHTRGVVVGVSPHGPATAGEAVFDHATRLSENRAVRVTTHAAETPEELEFLRTGDGPWRDHLQRLGVWDEGVRAPGVHPIDWLEPYLKRGRWLLVHCNYVEEDHVRLLKRTGTSVAYCPVASDYFRHPVGGAHRYREMLEAGVNVCLGTDSAVCQPGDACQPLGVLAQMRHLWRRDRTPAATLLQMATTHGMLALEFREDEATLSKGAPGIFAAVPIDPDDPTDPLEQALSNDAAVEVVGELEGG